MKDSPKRKTPMRLRTRTITEYSSHELDEEIGLFMLSRAEETIVDIKFQTTHDHGCTGHSAMIIYKEVMC